MKQRYQQPQTLVVNITTGSLLQTSTNPLNPNIEGPTISSGVSSRRGRDYWDEEDENWDED